MFRQGRLDHGSLGIDIDGPGGSVDHEPQGRCRIEARHR
jgi:hypothetical protein